MEANAPINPLLKVAEQAHLTERPSRVLAVDDEQTNLDILAKHLAKASFEPILATDGQKALNELEAQGHKIDAILLDKMMPGLDGFEVLRRIKAHPEWRNIPVIMQTAAVSAQDAIEGIESGAYYYITKPYSAKMLISVTRSALSERKRRIELSDRMKKTDAVLNLITRCEYEFRTIEEARALAAHLAKFSAEPSRTVLGLAALMINAVEHGNLRLGREMKSALITSGEYEAELQRRMSDPVNAQKKVTVVYKREGTRIEILIKDQGEGFRWKEYMDFDPSRLTEPNGRGIATANIMNPGAFAFHGNGNQVIYTLSAGNL